MINLNTLIQKDFAKLNDYQRKTLKDHIKFHKEVMRKENMQETEAYQNWKEYLFEPIIQELICLKLINKKERNEKRTIDIYNIYMDISLRMFHSYDEMIRIFRNDMYLIKFFCYDYYSDIYGENNKLYKKKMKKLLKKSGALT